MQARGFLNYRLKYCWLKLICCICQHELEREMRPHKARANEVQERTPTTNNIVLFRFRGGARIFLRGGLKLWKQKPWKRKIAC